MRYITPKSTGKIFIDVDLEGIRNGLLYKLIIMSAEHGRNGNDSSIEIYEVVSSQEKLYNSKNQPSVKPCTSAYAPSSLSSDTRRNNILPSGTPRRL
jgi:hypothetical protein